MIAQTEFAGIVTTAPEAIEIGPVLIALMPTGIV
jgi:hypothetical protein